MAAVTEAATLTAGELVRFWRRERRMTQLELSLEAGVSTRHLSCVETGQAKAGRDLLAHLCRVLDIPRADRRRMLLAAGFAPVAEPAAPGAERLSELQAIVDAHAPSPALICDAALDVVCANRAAELLWRDVAAELRTRPLNLLRLATDPGGLPKVSTVSPRCSASLARHVRGGDGTAVAALASFTLATPAGPVMLQTIVTRLGEPADTDDGALALETFLPADADSARRLRELAAAAA